MLIEIVERSVEMIRSALRDPDHLQAARTAVLGLIGIGEHFDFGHRIDFLQALLVAASEQEDVRLFRRLRSEADLYFAVA